MRISLYIFRLLLGSGPKGRRFKSCHLDHNLSENDSFRTSFLLILNKIGVQKAENKGLLTLVFPLSLFDARDKHADA